MNVIHYNGNKTATKLNTQPPQQFKSSRWRPKNNVSVWTRPKNTDSWTLVSARIASKISIVIYSKYSFYTLVRGTGSFVTNMVLCLCPTHCLSLYVCSCLCKINLEPWYDQIAGCPHANENCLEFSTHSKPTQIRELRLP